MSATNSDREGRAIRASAKLHQHHYGDGGFDCSLPRPPALGEERAARAPERGGAYSPDGAAPKRDDAAPPAAAATPPTCLAWAHSLRNLLQDQDGVDLFVRYLESEGPQHANALHFWFACEGLRKCPLDNVKKLVKLIHKTYFMKSTLPINDEMKREITKNLKSSQCLDPPITLFDEAQAQIERLINNTTYPNFLKSDMYLQYLQSVQNPSRGSDDLSSGDSSSSSSLSNTRDILPNLISGGGIGPLPTLHENKMYIGEQALPLVTTPGSVSTGHHTPTTVSSSLRLTKNMLWRSQNHRALDIPPKSEPYASLFVVRSGAGAHAAYNSYNPVSRQDSEMQSLSSHSDVRTESDSMSLSDYATESRGTSSRARHHHKRTSHEAKHAKDLASLNRESNMHQVFIPRMLRSDAVRNCPPMDVQQHAAILTAKLEIVKRQQETQDLLHKKLKESDSMSSLEDRGRPTVPGREVDPKFHPTQQQPQPQQQQQMDDNDQDILDEHVNRVFSDPETFTSRPLSPHGGAGVAILRGVRRKDRDGFSTFSGDSGNVHDFSESMTKSKSMPEHVLGTQQQLLRRRSSKKALTDLTDSGVSVVSGTAPSGGGGGKDYHVVIDWLIKSDRGRGGGTAAHSEMAAASGRRRRASSRSSSLERKSACGPAQPFVADPCMPPPPHPNTETQLEEARRRLEEDAKARTKYSNKSSLGNSLGGNGNNNRGVELCQSSQSTLRKSVRLQQQQQQQRGFVDDGASVTMTTTTTVFAFCDEQFPYRIKIPGTQITLKQFKEYLPKKGNYRFFFKTVCADLGNQVTQEEITNDSEVLPLWEDKIMGQVKAID